MAEENMHSGKVLRIYVGLDDTSDGQPLYEAIVRKLLDLDVAGAAVYRGLMGYGVHRQLHEGSILDLGSDLPVVITVIDSEAKIRAALPVLSEMIPEGLATISDAEVIEYGRGKRLTNLRTSS